MLTISYSGRSRPSAERIAEISGDINIVRRNGGDVNWGRQNALTELNPDITNATNKRVMRELFKEHDVPTPTLFNIGYAHVEVMHGRWLIGRPDRHSKGRGLWLCKTLEDYEKALLGTRRKKAATHFMKYIEHDREYRVHIFLGKSIRISEKKYLDDTKKEYTTGKPLHDVRKVRKAAKQAVLALGLDFGAVDIITKGDDNQEVYVLEVNAAPGLGGSMPKLYAETFLNWYNQKEE
jgi:glutathione synthase/RimK-type ligase-like ATP-grasp enzyme